MARPARCRFPLLLASLGTAAALAGCGGGPEPAQPVSPFPPRPVSIDVSRLDPCAGMPAEEIERLDLDAGAPSTATVDGVPSPACTWVGYDSTTYIYGAQIIPLGAAVAVDEPGSRIIDVNGFGAVQGAAATNNGPRQPAFCQIVVDVADGQTLRFQVSSGDPTTGGDTGQIDAVCTEAQRFATQYLVAIRA